MTRYACEKAGGACMTTRKHLRKEEVSRVN
jgi:hypothetical protein